MLAVSHALLSLVLFGPLVSSTIAKAGDSLRVEAFTTAGYVIGGRDGSRLRIASVTIYRLDGLAEFEAALSQDLPAGADAAKAEALRRIGELDEERMAPMKHAALGLAKAVHYGIDRYPAIVIDETAVIYGVTDLDDALQRYAAWQEAKSR
jgi:integrating conjugative element protein (TIGR03757 family)